MPVDEIYQFVKQRSSQGVKWVAIAEVGIRLIQFGTSVALARLLFPKDFGIISMVLIFVQFAYVIFDFGLTSALIQREELSESHFSSAFVAYVFAALLFGGLTFIGAPFIARFFHHTILQPMLRVLVVLFFLYSLNAIPKAQLMRKMEFKVFSRLQLIAAIGYAVMAISTAALGVGPWCFVYGLLAEQTLLIVLLWMVTHWRPRFSFSWQHLKELLSFGSNVLGTRLVGYVNANVPYFFIGKILGATLLGYYSLAYQLIDFPVQRISKNVLKVMFPAFSRLQNHPEDFQRLYLQVLYYLALVTFPIFFGLYLIAPLFVPLVYGTRWQAAIVPLQILTVVGMTRSLWTTASVIFLAKGHPRLEFRIQMLYALSLIPSLYWATHWGVNGVAATLAILLFLFYLVALVRALRLIYLSLWQIVRVFWFPFAGALIFLTLGILERTVFHPVLASSALLAVLVISSVAVYVGFIFWRDRQIFSKLLQFLFA